MSPAEWSEGSQKLWFFVEIIGSAYSLSLKLLREFNVTFFVCDVLQLIGKEMHRFFSVLAAAVTVAPIMVYADGLTADFAEDRVESCAEIAVFLGMDYSDIKVQPPDTLRILSQSCVARDSSWFSGTESINGFTKTIAYSETEAIFEVLSEGAASHERSRLGVARANDFFPFELGVDVWSYTVSLNAKETGAMAQADMVSAQGFGIDGAMKPLQDLPDGRWLVFVYPKQAVQLSGSQVNMSRGALSQVPILLTKTGETTTTEQLIMMGLEGHFWEDLELSLDLTGGSFSGQMEFSVPNRQIPEARGPGDFDTAQLSMDAAMGRAIASTNGGVFVAVGRGTANARTDEGASHVYPYWFDILAAKVPDDFSSDELKAWFKGE